VISLDIKSIDVTSKPYMDKLVLLSGTSGVRINYILDIVKDMILSSKYDNLSPSTTGIYKFEEELTRVYRTHIENIISLLLESRPAAIDTFKQAVINIVQDVVMKGYSIAYIAIHLTYLCRGILIPNPIIGYLVRTAREVTIIYYLEDFYHGLYKMNLELFREETKPRYIIDPIMYLEWRGLDHNIISLLSSLHDNIETIIFGIKHPIETHKRLLHYASLMRRDGRKRYYLVYFSHPISAFQEEYLKQKDPNRGLSSLVGVRNIEKFKRLLITKFKELILFEPTTIDELIFDSREVLDKAICSQSSTVSHTSCSAGSILAYSRSKDIKLLSPYITTKNRWPISKDAPQYKDYYSCMESQPLNMLSNEFSKLFGEQILEQMRNDFCNYIKTGVKTYLVDRINSLISTQIKMRDYEYVIQSSAIFAYKPVFYLENIDIDRESSPDKIIIAGELLLATPLSRGMDAEIRRALAFSKPVYLFIHLIESSKDYIDYISSNLRDNFQIVRATINTDASKTHFSRYSDESIKMDIIRGEVDKMIFGESPFTPGIIRVFIDKNIEDSIDSFISLIKKY